MENKIKETDVFNLFEKIFGKDTGGTVRPSDHDDCAVIPFPPTKDVMVATVDAIRGKHFSLWDKKVINHYDLGHYVVAANLSDIAAMGAYPIAFLNSFRWNSETKLKQVEDYFKGMKDALKKFSYYGLCLNGGDTGSYPTEHMTGVALGRSHIDHVLYRKGVRPGDLLCVTGTVGDMNAALIYFNAKKKPPLPSGELEALKDSWKRPPARISEGVCLSGNHPSVSDLKPKIATACMDTSDGVRTAIHQLSRINEVGFDIWGDHLPINLSTMEVARLLNRQRFEIQLGIAPDFELLFTIGEEDFEECCKRFNDANLDAPSLIGKVNNAGINRFYPNRGANPFKEFPGENWNHQGIEKYLQQFSF